MRLQRRLLPLLLLLAAASCTAQPWRAWPSPEAAGLDSDRLDEARDIAERARSGAVMIVRGGHVVAAWGDVTREFQMHSVRKSLVSALYGVLVGDGTIDIDATLGELGIDDDAGLTDLEKSARVRDVIAARSGVFLPAAYAPDDQNANRPERDSEQPGDYWFYNNWDFNVAGVILERETGEDLYALFDRLIAQPIGMEDYAPDDGFLVYEPSSSRHPAHTFRMSTRDLARFGQLYLQNGRWNGHQVVPADWVEVSTQPITDFGNLRGYGYMWWTYAAGNLGDNYPNADRYDIFLGRGTGGQAVFVIPAADMVVVHRGDTDNGRPVGGGDIWSMVDIALGAIEGDPDGSVRLVDVQPVPLDSQAPRPDPLAIEELSDAEWAEIHGEYALGPDAAIRVFEWKGRHFIHVPGEGEGEMLPLGDDRFAIPVVPGVRTSIERDADGGVTAIALRLGSDVIRGVKR